MTTRDRLTAVDCKNASSDGKKIKKLHDGQGLYLWIYADGKKYWRLRYKLFGQEKSISLGTYPATSLKQARQSAQAEREKLTSNIDPSIDRKVTKQRAKQAAENSFEAVSREWYAKQIHTWVHSHAKADLSTKMLCYYLFLLKKPAIDMRTLSPAVSLTRVTMW